jgi:hypothetical protein
MDGRKQSNKPDPSLDAATSPASVPLHFREAHDGAMLCPLPISFVHQEDAVLAPTAPATPRHEGLQSREAKERKEKRKKKKKKGRKKKHRSQILYH